MRFIFDNALEDASLTSSDNYSTAFGVSNIIDHRLAKKWRSFTITDLMTNGSCEETTSPTLDNGTIGLTNATWARSAVEKYEGSYSWVLTKTSAAAGGDAENYLTDNINTDDLHGLINGYTYQLATYLFTDIATIANAKVIVQEYYAAAWHDVLTLQATIASTWQEKKGTFTLNIATTAVTIKLFIDTDEDAAKVMYLDDIRLYRENRIFADMGSGNTLNPTVCYIAGHNLTSAAIVKIQGNATNEWTNPTVNETITYDALIMLEWITGSALRYWSLLIDDEDNPNGYVEIGYFDLGLYTQLNRGAARVFPETPSDKSVVMEGSSGQILGKKGAVLREWEINIPYWDNTMKASFDALYEEVGTYKPFCIILDENNISYFPPKYCRITSHDYTHVKTFTNWSARIAIKECK